LASRGALPGTFALPLRATLGRSRVRGVRRSIVPGASRVSTRIRWGIPRGASAAPRKALAGAPGQGHHEGSAYETFGCFLRRSEAIRPPSRTAGSEPER
jgi:hypothetical protein